MRLDRDSYVPGEPILLLLDFQNHSDKVYIREPGRSVEPKPYDNLDHGTEYNLQAVLKGPHGFVQTWRPRFRKNPNARVHTSSSFWVYPHERQQCTIILSRVFRPTAPGKYKLNWTLELPIRDRKLPLDRPSKGLRLEAEGTARIRVVAANRDILEKRADALLAEAQEEKRYYVPSLFILATMPPDIALPRLRRFFNLKNTKKVNGLFRAAVHALAYVDTKEAVDLILEVVEWTREFDKVHHQLPQSDRDDGYATLSECGSSLANMYYMTNNREVWRYLRTRLPRHQLQDPRRIEPKIPST